MFVISGHTGCDGQPAVHPGGDTVEDLLEIQPEPGWRSHVGCVSGYIFKANIQNSVSVLVAVAVLFIQTVCVSCSHDESEKRLPKSCLVILCKYEPVLRWSRDCDNSLYQSLVEILIPDVLRPIPSKALQ